MDKLSYVRGKYWTWYKFSKNHSEFSFSILCTRMLQKLVKLH